MLGGLGGGRKKPTVGVTKCMAMLIDSATGRVTRPERLQGREREKGIEGEEEEAMHGGDDVSVVDIDCCKQFN